MLKWALIASRSFLGKTTEVKEFGEGSFFELSLV
jgi:hypothetical protein